MKSRFSFLTGYQQHDANIAKAGAYYTDLAHASAIGRLLQFPEKKINVLEPSIGDASAVLSMIGEREAAVFGIEMNEEVARQTNRNARVELCLRADFLRDVRISNNAFSLCFANPPYGETESRIGGEMVRLEKVFLNRIYPYVQTDGVLVWIIPLIMATDLEHLTQIFSKWHMEAAYRFHDSEYEKYKQIVFFLRKRGKAMANASEQAAKYRMTHGAKEDFPLLPFEEYGEKILVPEPGMTVKIFQTVRFDVEQALEELMEKEKKDGGIFDGMMRETAEKKAELHPPMEIGDDSMFLTMVSGVGSGIAGSSEQKTIHLQRGALKKSVDTLAEEKEGDSSGKKFTVRERSYYRAYLTIIEPSGKIQRLE